MKYQGIAVCLVVGLVGCSASHLSPDEIDALKRRASASHGQADDGGDLCLYYDWYGDGECDPFCPEADRDCDESPATDAGVPDPTFADGAVSFPDGDVTPAEDAGEPVDPTPVCPELEVVHSCFTLDVFECPEGTEWYVGADIGCGCGCVAVRLPPIHPCEASSDCEADEYCELFSCGGWDSPGNCVARPEACTFEYNPVCGCDNVTYGNECEAHAAGASIMSIGECGGSEGSDCRTTGCPSGETCEPCWEAYICAPEGTGTAC